MKLYFVLALAFMLVQVATSTSTSTDGSTTTTEVSTTTTDASTTSADTTSTVTATETTTVTAETTSTVALSTTSDSGTDASTTTSSGDSTTAPTSDVPTGDSSTAASTSDATGGGSTEASTTGATGDSTTVAATSDATTGGATTAEDGTSAASGSTDASTTAEDSSTDASTSGATGETISTSAEETATTASGASSTEADTTAADSSSTPDSSSDATSGETATTAAEETPATATGSTDNFASTDTEATSSLPSDATTDGSSPASNTAEVTSEATSGDSTTESYTTVDGQTTDSSTDAPVSQGSTTPDGEDEETTPTPSGANYGPWSGYGNYSSDCGTAYRTRTRDCVDENDDKVDISLCEALGESIEFESVELSPCDCQVHPCLDINGNHTDELCNPSSDTSHTCFEDYDAETLTCLLQCQCEQGFENVQDGAACSDIDECSISGTQCYKENSLEPRDNVDECINTRGSYECTCQEGYKNPAYSDKDCVDINECADADVCGDPARIHCENTPGSYKCVCAEGFISVDGECIFDRFILKNYEDDYDEVINAGDSDIFTEVFYIPDGGYLSSDDQHSVINSIYATKSGLIIFHSSDDEEIDQAAFPQPKRNLNDWSKALEYVDDGIVKVAAVYWADGIFAADGAMYTKLVDLTREGNQTAYTAILPNATWAYVVTWKKITPNQKPVDPTQVNTFQAVVVGDGVKRTIRVKMTYQDSGMTWNLPLAALTEAFDYPARIGTFFNSKEEPIYEQYPFSRLYRANYTSEVVKISRVDQYTKLGNMGSIKSAGQFVYTITSQSANYIAPSTQCSSWINLERNKGQTRVLSIVSGLCASAFAQIQPFILASFRQVSGSTPGYTCYEAARPLLGQYTPRCCYDEEGGLLPASKDDVASVNGLSTVVGNVFTAQMDDQAYSTCCDLELNENGLVPEWMCDDFFELKPACTSDFFIARAVSQVRGDPHITTLDGLTYTFNGHGEYTLIKSSDFELQGRTAPVGTPAGATVFTGFAGSLNGSTKAQISLNETGNGIELWINGSLQSYNWSSSRQYGNVRVFKNDAQYTMAFDNDVNVQISPMFDLQMMVVSIIMPPDLQNKVRGLMGNYNGNSSDDLFAVNGTSISENSTEDAIFPIGKTWEATAGTTLFSYGSGLSFSDYSDPDFVPVFFNPDLTVMFTNATERATAINLCNPSGGGVDNNPELRKECYFDFAVTKNADAAAATVNAANKLASEKASLANFAPKINMNGTVLRVVAGRSYYGVLQIIATDSNEGDVLTYNMTRGPVEVTVDQRTGNVSWERVAFNPNGSLEFTVSDGKAVALFRPKVALCYCKNNGSCLFNASMPNNWNVVPCRCAPGWTGQICDQDIDGCAQNPCFTNCRDVPASQVARLGEFQCDPCPAGLSGDGRTCFDVNECLQKPSPCAQDCTNTAGSYSCSCRPGYAIGGDGRSCVDIDECRLRTDNCDAHAACINTAGGFNCTCNTGYAGKGTVGECTNIDECARKTFTCPNNSICVDTPGSYECRCLFGYKLQEGKCINIDECALGNKCSQICKDGIGSYTCQCRDFFVLNATDKTSCSPNVTCTAAEVLQCDGGNARSTCGKDSSGNVICICPQGYTLNPQNICQDNDECKAENLCSSSTSTCVNREPGYYCQCKPGFTKSSDGVTCEDIDECETRTNNCSKICANTAGGYVCRCPEGYTLGQDGFTCKDNNECASALTNDCDRLNGNCNNTLLNDVTPFGYVCGCKPGYQLTADRVTCIDLNECQQQNKGGCSQGCSNTQGSFSCFCAAGYELGSDGKTCTDVNECASEITNNCFDNTYCSNNVGGYTCSCPVGFRLMSDGFTCVSILKCAEDNQCAHSCSRFNGTDVCTCPLGQALNPADNITCIDLDECALGLHVCNSSFNVVCTNQDPGYVCDCASTYFKQVEPAKCIDIDECAEGRSTCDLASSYCSNKLNGYDCICNEGYQKSDGSCVDINECFGENLCNTNTSTCKNEPGSYSCECKAGYEGAGLTCNDVNECAGSNKCDADYGTCLNTVGSYICGCSQGYTLTSTQRCADINECDNEALYNITCEDACINTPGSWKCGCQTGFVLDVDGRSCVAMQACNVNNTCEHDCYASNGVDICVCYLGYQLEADNTSCVDIDECATGANDCDKANGKCTNTDGSYTCSCINQYTLSPTRECKDRDGDFGDWSAWGSCTPACGNTMTQSRSRNCNNPSRQGLGKDCEGELNETQACPSVLCEAAKTNGVEMTLSGLSKDEFDKITTQFQVGITKGMNEHCTSNTSVAQECCANPAITILSTIGKTFIESDELSVYSFSVTGSATSVRLVLVAEIDPANTLCNAPFNRKRRAVSFVPRSVLLGILSNPTVAAKITTTVKQSALSVLGKTITVTASAPSLPAELQTTPAPAVTTTQQQVVVQPSVQAWVIAVAVVGSLLAVAVVVIIVVVILKRPRKVAASDHAIRSP